MLAGPAPGVKRERCARAHAGESGRKGDLFAGHRCPAVDYPDQSRRFPEADVSTSLFVHATGLAALGLSLSGAMHRCDHRLRRHSFLAGLCWALNYALLGAPLGAALSCVSAARTGTATLVVDKGRRLRVLACALFLGASLATAIYTWQDWTTLLPVASSILTTYAVFFLSGTPLRFALLLAAMLWTQNVLSLNCPEQIVGNFLGIGLAAVGLWRAGNRDRGRTAR
jgi:hypothetical protein